MVCGVQWGGLLMRGLGFVPSPFMCKGVKHGPAAHPASMKMRPLFRQTLFEGGDFHSRGLGEGFLEL